MHIPDRPPLLSFEPIDPDAPGIEVQWLNQNHILTQMATHRHRFLQIVYFEQGGGQYRLGARTWSIEAGDLFLTAPGETHDATAIGQAEGWVVLFTADAIEPSRPDAGSYLYWLSHPLFLPFLRSAGVETGHFIVPVEARPLWSQHLQTLATELSTKQLGYREAARAILSQILVAAARLAAAIFEGFPIQEQPLLAEVFNFIEAHYTERISLADVAVAVGRSSAYLTTLIRRLTGRTVLEWITERRLAEARRLLLETDEDITSISVTIGYRDPTHFIRQFRQVHGITPLVWRRTNRTGS